MLKRTAILFVAFIIYSCNKSNIYRYEQIEFNDHNQVVKLVIEDILSDKNDIILGTPCSAGYFRVDQYTIAPDGVFLDEFKKDNKGYFYEHIKLDTNFIQKGINCKVEFCNNLGMSDYDVKLYIQNKCKNYPSYSFSSIVKGRNKNMSIFIYGNNGDDPQYAEYLVYKVDNQWKIELRYQTTNEYILRKCFEEFKLTGRKNF